MKKWIFISVFMGSLGLWSKPAPFPQGIVSLQVKQGGLRSSLEKLLNSSDLKYEIKNSVGNDQKISVDVRGAKWGDVFRYMMNDGNLNYQFNRDGVLVISRGQ